MVRTTSPKVYATLLSHCGPKDGTSVVWRVSLVDALLFLCVNASACGRVCTHLPALPSPCPRHQQRIKSESLSSRRRVEPTPYTLSCFRWENEYFFIFLLRGYTTLPWKPLNLALPNHHFLSFLFCFVVKCQICILTQCAALLSAFPTFFARLWRRVPVCHPQRRVDEMSVGQNHVFLRLRGKEPESLEDVYSRRLLTSPASLKPSCPLTRLAFPVFSFPDTLRKWSRPPLRSSTACGSTETWGASTKR